MNAIEANQVSMQYRTGVLALDNLDLTVKQGEVFTLLGKNGAGKSTLINIFTTFRTPTSGEVRILNQSITKQTLHSIRKDIACVAQKVSVDEHLTLLENMKFQSKIYKIDSSVAKKRIEELIETFGLQSYLDYPVSNYSGGIKRRLDIAMNMVTYPKILFLDEPTVGMDIFSRKAMWDCIKKVKEVFGTTIFLTTHYLEEAEFLSNTICIIDKGKKVIQGNKNELAKLIEKQYLSITIDDNSNISFVEEEFKKKYPNHSLLVKESQLLLENMDIQMDTIIRLLKEKGIEFSGINIIKPTLEDIFLEIINRKEEFLA